MAATDERRVIPAWRLIGGIFLHFTVPAYLLTLAIAGTSAALHGRPLAAMLGNVVHLSGWFLLVYVLLGLVSVGLLAAGEALWTRSRSTPQARRSAARLARALTAARSAFGEAARPSLDILAGHGWDHADPRFQALAADLAELVTRTSAALASAPPERRETIAKLGRDSLAHITASFEALAAERGRLDEGDVRVIARYVESRYGPSDFPSSG